MANPTPNPSIPAQAPRDKYKLQADRYDIFVPVSGGKLLLNNPVEVFGAEDATGLLGGSRPSKGGGSSRGGGGVTSGGGSSGGGGGSFAGGNDYYPKGRPKAINEEPKTPGEQMQEEAQNSVMPGDGTKYSYGVFSKTSGNTPVGNIVVSFIGDKAAANNQNLLHISSISKDGHHVGYLPSYGSKIEDLVQDIDAALHNAILAFGNSTPTELNKPVIPAPVTPPTIDPASNTVVSPTTTTPSDIPTIATTAGNTLPKTADITAEEYTVDSVYSASTVTGGPVAPATPGINYSDFNNLKDLLGKAEIEIKLVEDTQVYNNTRVGNLEIKVTEVKGSLPEGYLIARMFGTEGTTYFPEGNLLVYYSGGNFYPAIAGGKDITEDTLDAVTRVYAGMGGQSKLKYESEPISPESFSQNANFSKPAKFYSIKEIVKI